MLELEIVLSTGWLPKVTRLSKEYRGLMLVKHLERIDKLSIYTAEGCQEFENCSILIIDHSPGGLCFNQTLNGLYYRVNDLACITDNNQYTWYQQGCDITDSVKQWLEANHYTWPLNRTEHTHWILTFL